MTKQTLQDSDTQVNQKKIESPKNKKVKEKGSGKSMTIPKIEKKCFYELFI